MNLRKHRNSKGLSYCLGYHWSTALVLRPNLWDEFIDTVLVQCGDDWLAQANRFLYVGHDHELENALEIRP